MKYAIIGAGIGGLTTALAFEQRGIDYQIFEKAPILNEVGAGIWLAPNALQVLEHLEVLDEVKRSGNSIDRITLGLAELTILSDNYQDSIKSIFGYSTIAIHRAELQNILFSKIPSRKIHLGKGFSSFEKLSEGKTRIYFEDNSEIETCFLIGADGINSKIRKQLFPNSEIRYSGQTCWRGVANYKLDNHFGNRGIELWGDQVRFGMSKIGHDKVYWFAVALDKANQKDISPTKENLLGKFSNFHPLCNQLIDATVESEIIRNDINDLRSLKNWHKSRICLIGDAAHATTPNLGQGGAQAIEDAYYLSNLIDKQSEDNIFDLFQSIREEKVKSIVNQSWMTGKMAHWKYGKLFRNFLLKNLPKKVLERKMIELYQIDKGQ